NHSCLCGTNLKCYSCTTGTPQYSALCGECVFFHIFNCRYYRPRICRFFYCVVWSTQHFSDHFFVYPRCGACDEPCEKETRYRHKQGSKNLGKRKRWIALCIQQ